MPERVSAYVERYWYDSYGRLRVTVVYECEQTYEMEIPDEGAE